MPTTLLFGGNGKVARYLTKLLVAEGHSVHSIIRNASQSSELEALGAKVILQSIEDMSVSEFVTTIKAVNPDCIVWAAGAGVGSPDRTRTVDCEGAIKSMDAAAAAGVKRYIIVSALDLRDRTNKPVPDWYDEASKAMSDRLWKVIEPYLSAKLEADKNLREHNTDRKLDYTIVRPGGLNQEPGVGTIAAGKVSLSTMISREDVARVIVACMKNDGTVGLAFDVVGGSIPVEEAVAEVAKSRVDTFDGFY